MKKSKFKKFVIFLLLVSIGLGGYFVFFSKQKGEKVATMLNSYNTNENVLIVDDVLEDLQGFLETNSFVSANQKTYDKICFMNDVSDRFNDLSLLSIENLIWIKNANKYKSEVKKYYNNTLNNYKKIVEYLNQYYFDLIPDNDMNTNKAQILERAIYISDLISDLCQNKIYLAKYLCLMQTSGHINLMDNTNLNALYLKTYGEVLGQYYSVSPWQENVTISKSQFVTKLNNFENELRISNTKYFQNKTKVDELWAISDKIDLSGLIKAYLNGTESEFLAEIIKTKDDKPVSEKQQKKYDETNKFLTEFLQGGF